MKNIKKNMLVVAIILLSSYASVHAQSFKGIPEDIWINNTDKNSIFSGMKSYNGLTSFSLLNIGNRFSFYCQPSNSTVAGDWGTYGNEIFAIGQKGDLFLSNSSGMKSIYTWSYDDPAWRIGMNNNPGFTRAIATSHVQYLTYSAGAGQGFAVGVNGGNSSFEVTGSDHKAFFRGNITQANNGTGISWGNNFSKIKDDTNLQILTDDILYIGKSDSNGNMTGTTMFANVVTGNVGIGTINPTAKLHVNGKINATDYAVVTAVAADYVFEKDYKLMSLSDTEAYIKANKHLPAFKSAKHYETNGYTMIEMNVALEQTIEEMTLHAIAQEKEINNLKSDMAQIKAMLLKK